MVLIIILDYYKLFYFEAFSFLTYSLPVELKVGY